MTTTTAISLAAQSQAGRWSDLILFALLVWGMALLCALALHGASDF